MKSNKFNSWLISFYSPQSFLFLLIAVAFYIYRLG